MWKRLKNLMSYFKKTTEVIEEVEPEGIELVRKSGDLLINITAKNSLFTVTSIDSETYETVDTVVFDIEIEAYTHVYIISKTYRIYFSIKK